MECPDLLGTWHSCPPLVPGLTLDERALFGDLAVPLVLLLAVTLLALATAAAFGATEGLGLGPETRSGWVAGWRRIATRAPADRARRLAAARRHLAHAPIPWHGAPPPPPLVVTSFPTLSAAPLPAAEAPARRGRRPDLQLKSLGAPARRRRPSRLVLRPGRSRGPAPARRGRGRSPRAA